MMYRINHAVIRIYDMNRDYNRKLLTEIFYTSLKAVDPYDSVKHYADKIHSVYMNGKFKMLHVVGFGKAACPMANAIEDNLGNLLTNGIVITKYGHSESQNSKVSGRGVWQYAPTNSKIKALEAGHPIPDKNGVTGTDEIIKLLKSADENTLIVCLISGGGSALLVSPCEGITLKEKQEITQMLLNTGADINDLNCVRKHISKVKGGRLAETAYPAKIISLILSDVIGDRLDVIASGPTSPDTTTYADALKVLEKYGLIDKAPKIVIEVLRKGAKGLIPETPKEGDKIFNNVENIIISSNKIAIDTAKNKAEEFGFHTEIISSELAGEARDVGRWLAEEVQKRGSSEVQKDRPAEKQKFKRPLCFISGGETTVTVIGKGLGGRNMELALVFAMEIEGMEGITLLSAGTDGTDGPTNAAGTIVDGNTVKKAKAAGLDPVEYLVNNDSYNFFKKIDGLLVTGPTGTNVMDLQIMVVE